MHIFKNKEFDKWAKVEGLSDNLLVKAAKELGQGLYEASLGGNIYKKRLPIAGKGKRGGARVIIAFKKDKITFFIYGFCKKQKDNITDREKESLKVLANEYFSYTPKQLSEAVDMSKLIEVIYEKIYS